MTIDEDYFLCVAYVNVISENPIFGNNQTGDNFWYEICNRYNDLSDESLGPKQEYVARSIKCVRQALLMYPSSLTWKLNVYCHMNSQDSHLH
jgi:hypothetical protein